MTATPRPQGEHIHTGDEGYVCKADTCAYLKSKPHAAKPVTGLSTKRPWDYKIGGRTIFIGHEHDGLMVESVATLDADQEGKANAALIVKAVNTHERVKAVLEQGLAALNMPGQDSYQHSKLRTDFCKQAKALLAEMEG